MKSKKGYMKIKAKCYNTTISIELPEDADLKELLEHIADLIAAMGYSEESINQYINIE